MINKLFIFYLLFFSIISCKELTIKPVTTGIDGGTILADVGGPNQPNQVYVDLSTGVSTSVRRDVWDLGFYTGNKFSVVLNSSLLMAAAALTGSDINLVNSLSEEVQSLQNEVRVGVLYSEGTQEKYVDGAFGTIIDLKAPFFGERIETAIAEISDTDSDNPVYLLNLGREISNDIPNIGDAETYGNNRGWKKIRILKRANNYLLQYANLDDTNYKEVSISKNQTYNFTFFSFSTESEVSVEPPKASWDLNFTVFTNTINGTSLGDIDFVLNNVKGGARAYKMFSNPEAFNYSGFSFDNFTFGDVVIANFIDDQRSIGKSWRTISGKVNDSFYKLEINDVFYILKDTEGNLYKIKFDNLVNAKGERGYPQFTYNLLK
ncbi:MAG: HmuY family protein [Tenacibaculum sp.]